MNIDPISWKILSALQTDGRISLKALAAHAGLSLPATSERLKRLEEAGVIEGYRATMKATGGWLRCHGNHRYDHPATG